MVRSIKFFSVLCLVTMFCVSCSDLFENENGTDGTVEDNDVYVQNPNAVDGALKGVFSVSEDKKVHFSQGNLQYKECTKTWRFASNQWNYVGTQNPDDEGWYGGNVEGSDNCFVSFTGYEGWIDLFHFGTSGWNSGAVVYKPFDVSYNCSDFYVGGRPGYGLFGNHANADWGVYNKIKNGGNQAGLWRTLRVREWDYLIRGRQNCENLQACGRVNGVNGFILLPDDWQLPDSIEFMPNPKEEPKTSYDYTIILEANDYTVSEWDKMEKKGAIFLPCSGTRLGTYIYRCGFAGDYWSSSTNSPDDDEYFGDNAEYFTIGYTATTSYFSRKCAYSVRLVQDIQ